MKLITLIIASKLINMHHENIKKKKRGGEEIYSHIFLEVWQFIP